MRTRAIVVAVALVAAVLMPALPALAKSFTLPAADIELEVSPDGSVLVTERITFSFNGDFSGAYRDIPVRAGEEIVDISVSEGGVAYEPGACAELGCLDDAGTFGVRDLGDRIRVVWHYSAFSERRTFDVAYRFVGLAKAYDDVVDVNLQVWGDEWTVGLDRLTATLGFAGTAEPGEVLVWGHPAEVAGTVGLGPDGLAPELEASRIPPGQFVEFRIVLPRSAISSTEGATVIDGDGLESILAEEQREAAIAENQRLVLVVLILLGIVMAFLPGTLAAVLIWWRFGREPKVDYDREYEQEPPSDHPPAVVEGLLSQGRVDELGFTATVFDLIRRDVLGAQPVSAEKSTWGGLKTEQITDLELSLRDHDEPLADHERSVVRVMERVLDDGPQPLNRFRERIRDDASANATTYQTFRTKAVEALETGGLLDKSGQGWMVGAGMLIIALFAVAIWLSIWLAGDSTQFGIVIPIFIVGLFVNFAIYGVFTALRKGWVKRTPEGALLFERWRAFQRYLRDFSRLEEAPVISLDLWDRYLVYAIALGVAEEVLEAARLRAPEELEHASHIYWYGSYGYTGGHTENAFAGMTTALSGAFTPPSSGGGGGFSGGGGFGGGGGGGGAW